MTEFEWLRRTRALAQPRTPEHDLWAGIAARIEVQAPPRVSQRRPWRAAAALLLGFGTLFGAWTWQRTGQVAELAQHAVTLPPERTEAGDPRLAGGRIELDSAAAELQQMIAQQPEAVFLVGLLNRTNEQRLRLAQRAQQAG